MFTAKEFAFYSPYTLDKVLLYLQQLADVEKPKEGEEPLRQVKINAVNESAYFFTFMDHKAIAKGKIQATDDDVYITGEISLNSQGCFGAIMGMMFIFFGYFFLPIRAHITYLVLVGVLVIVVILEPFAQTRQRNRLYRLLYDTLGKSKKKKK